MFEPPIKKIKLSETEKKFENQVSLCRPVKQQCGNSADVACSKPEETACEISVSLEYLVDGCMHEEEHIVKAIDILSSVPFQYPPSNILKFLLEKLSEENLKDNVKSAIFAYLSRLILVYPPSDHTHSYYFMAMCKPHICWWEFIYKIIQTSTQEPETSDDQQLSSIKGCRIFLKILVEIFTKDFENSKEVNSMDLVYDRRKPFIALLFFIPGLENVRVKMLLFSIEGLICISPNDEKLEMLSILMQILKLIADCALVKAANHEILALHKPNLGVLVRLIFSHCREILKDFEKFKIFLSFLSPKWLKLKVLEDQIQKFCLKSNSGKPSYIPLTLRKIVRRYMFPPVITFSEPEKDNILGKSKLSTSYVNSRNNKGENRLHRACISKKPESLKELLISGADINARDYAGWTPLHESCYRGNYECSSILMKWFPANLSLVTVSAEYLTSVDISASNNGVTPFHEAVLSGNADLVRLFLQFGGLSLNRIRDKGGSKPLDYASPELLEAVKETPKRACQFDQNYFNFDGDLSYQSRICVQLQDCALYEKYLYLLFLMLNEYMDLTTLRDLRNFFCQRRRSCSDKLEDILKHFVELHDLSFDMENCAFLMDDLFIFQNFPVILKTFKKQVMEHVSSENNVLAHLSSLELLCYSL